MPLTYMSYSDFPATKEPPRMNPIEVMLRHIEELIEIYDDPTRSGFLLHAHPEAPALLREVRAFLKAAKSSSLEGSDHPPSGEGVISARD